MKPPEPQLHPPLLITITLDGRNFRSVVDSPFVKTQVDYIIANLRNAGTVEIFNDLDGIQRTKERRPEDLLTQIMLSGRTHRILAGILIEEGKVWSRAAAHANEVRFAAITDAEEKKNMHIFLRNFLALVGGPDGTAIEIVKKMREAN